MILSKKGAAVYKPFLARITWDAWTEPRPMPRSRCRFEGISFGLGVCLALCCLFFWPSPVLSQNAQVTADSLLAEASSLYETGQRSEGAARRTAYQAVVRHLDRIVEEFPGSDLSVQILLGESVGEIDLTEVERTLAQTVDTDASMDESASVPAISDLEARREPVSSDPAGTVQRCFSVSESADLGEASVILRFTPDGEGRLQEAPVLVAPARPAPAERRLFRLGSAALEQCQPYRGFKAGESVELVFGATGVAMSDIQRAEAQPTQVEDALPSEEGIALATDPSELPIPVSEALPLNAVDEDTISRPPSASDVPVPMPEPVADAGREPPIDLSPDAPGVPNVAVAIPPESVPDVATEATMTSIPAPAPMTGLAGAVQRCFAIQAVGDIGDSFVQLRVVLDRQGRLEGPPVLTAPGGRAGAAERRLLRLGSAALEECQPYAEASEFSSVELVFRASGVSLVETTARTAKVPDGLKPKEEPTLAFAPAANPPEPASSDRSGLPAAMGQQPAVRATPAVSQPSASLPTSPPLPVRPRVAVLQSAEEALALDRAARREIQRRLVLLGFDTRGVDGVFGPGTRGAISNWQNIRGHSVTGFLDRSQLQDLQAQTEAAFEQWSRKQASAQPRTKPTPSGGVRQDSGVGRYLDDRGCLREADGRYVPNFKLNCR